MDFKLFLHLIRGIFPKWNFFDRVGAEFELKVLTSESSEWQRVSFEQNRSIFNLLLSPNINLALAEICLIEIFTQDLDDPTSYKLVRSLVESKFPLATHFKIEAENVEIFHSGPL